MAKKHRAYWKGYLRLSLVTIGVEVYNGIESKSEISFRQIHNPSGKRVNYEKTVQGVGKIDSADTVKRYEVDTDSYVILDQRTLPADRRRSDDCRDGATLRHRVSSLELRTISANSSGPARLRSRSGARCGVFCCYPGGERTEITFDQARTRAVLQDNGRKDWPFHTHAALQHDLLQSSVGRVYQEVKVIGALGATHAGNP